MCQNKCADCACAGADTRDFVRDLCQALQATRETRFPIVLPDLTELGNRSAT